MRAYAVNVLGFVKDGQLVVLPYRDRGMRLHRIVMLDGDAVLGFDFHRRIAQRFLGIASFAVRRARRDACGIANGFRVGDVFLRVVRDFDEPRGVARLFVCLGDDQRHRLEIEEDALGL
jgi:hypothetical protein